MAFVRFQLPDGRSFRQFDMPAVPREGERVITEDTRMWVVQAVVHVLTGVSQTQITVHLREP